jgi:hypothetical protein
LTNRESVVFIPFVTLVARWDTDWFTSMSPPVFDRHVMMIEQERSARRKSIGVTPVVGTPMRKRPAALACEDDSSAGVTLDRERRGCLRRSYGDESGGDRGRVLEVTHWQFPFQEPKINASSIATGTEHPNLSKSGDQSLN